jgi:hypothetical protein
LVDQQSAPGGNGRIGKAIDNGTRSQVNDVMPGGAARATAEGLERFCRRMESSATGVRRYIPWRVTTVWAAEEPDQRRSSKVDRKYFMDQADLR